MSSIVHTFFTPDPTWTKIGTASAQLARDWADEQGFQHQITTKRVWTATPSITWEKIRILADSIDSHDYNWHIFVDADMFVTNPGKTLKEIGLGDRLVYMGSDWIFPLNTGFLAVRKEARGLLEEMKRLRFGNPHEYFEQGTFQVIRTLSKKWSREIVPLTPRACNSYPPDAGEEWGGNWMPGDFVVHFAGWQKGDVSRFIAPTLGPKMNILLQDLLKKTREDVLKKRGD